jgi:hypothetical protein
MAFTTKLKSALQTNFEFHLSTDFDSDSESNKRVSEFGFASLLNLQLLPQKREFNEEECYLPVIVNPNRPINCPIEQISINYAHPCKKGDLYECKICAQAFDSGQALGGHVSRRHPGKSEDYMNKRRIRTGREADRAILNLAKITFYKSIGLDYALLKRTKDGNQILKAALNRPRLKQIKNEYKEMNLKI